jgi:hypothetical protein
MEQGNLQAVNGSGAPPEEGIYTMYEDILKDYEKFKKRPPQSMQDMYRHSCNLFEMIADIAYVVRENRVDIDSILDDQTNNRTQFTMEDAPKFDLVLQFAKENALLMLEKGKDMDESIREKLQGIVRNAEECLNILESNTLPPEEDESEGDGTGAST